MAAYSLGFGVAGAGAVGGGAIAGGAGGVAAAAGGGTGGLGAVGAGDVDRVGAGAEAVLIMGRFGQPASNSAQAASRRICQRMTISTRRFCGSRTPGPVGTRRLVSPKP